MLVSLVFGLDCFGLFQWFENVNPKVAREMNVEFASLSVNEEILAFLVLCFSLQLCFKLNVL